VSDGFSHYDLRPAINAVSPLVAAEAKRGNPARLDFGNMHNESTHYVLPHPIDLDALLAEFAFGDGVVLTRAEAGGVVLFHTSKGRTAFWMEGTLDESDGSRRRRARWWRRWSAAPRERTPFANPFADMPG
jgi:hypothetical protein